MKFMMSDGREDRSQVVSPCQPKGKTKWCSWGQANIRFPRVNKKIILGHESPSSQDAETREAPRDALSSTSQCRRKPAKSQNGRGNDADKEKVLSPG